MTWRSCLDARKIARQLNRGESLHAVRRDLHYANQGSIGAAHQGEQAWWVILLTSAVITWTTEYYQLGSAGFPAELTIRNKVLPSAAIRPWCDQRGPSSLRLRSDRHRGRSISMDA